MSNSIRVNLFSLFSYSLIGFGVWIYILYNYNPFTSDILTKAGFFASLFIWTSSFLAMILFFIRLSLVKKDNLKNYFYASIRQASIIAIIISGSLALKSINSLNAWQLIILMIIGVLIELFFIANPSIKKENKSI
ncbi:MAG: Uncharacterized protein CEN91_99 [Candidatus Berkelbacteria bacterium Licking1014_85]|uniref:Uncharacterized protein n=1 Tax=Candidatus Berkelbacteria bacterium Licking1014_85 TaxID=2017148 RepID=A0A554LM43_9BACT|nr:MAG: Uncharacterized protein CEN91_99 [Candidatus Berkelbacteria bacterium Licking1014_85]